MHVLAFVFRRLDGYGLGSRAWLLPMLLGMMWAMVDSPETG